ncbi:MAG: hypothetical protein EOO39_11655 [Cytophagaceae bacterium]|nr:MAG: hypothetical protein EOO39_11655 [Cytophagaceae bacterium]
MNILYLVAASCLLCFTTKPTVSSKKLMDSVVGQASTLENANAISSANRISNPGDSLSIQYVDLKVNKLLIREISKFIKEQSDSSTLFRSGFGYITLGGYLFDHPGPLPVDSLDKHQKDVVFSFSMHTCSYHIYDDPSPIKTFGNAFPLYYSYVDDRLVLFYDVNAKWFHRNAYSTASKQLLSGLVRKTLLQSLKPDFEFLGMDSMPYFLSVDRRRTMSEQRILEHSAFRLSAGKTYTEHYDGTITYRKTL